jgi:hypothetical protein
MKRKKVTWWTLGVLLAVVSACMGFLYNSVSIETHEYVYCVKEPAIWNTNLTKSPRVVSPKIDALGSSISKSAIHALFTN